MMSKTLDITEKAFMVFIFILDMELIENTPLNEWVTENYTQFSCNLEYITDKSPEGY